MARDESHLETKLTLGQHLLANYEALKRSHCRKRKRKAESARVGGGKLTGL